MSILFEQYQSANIRSDSKVGRQSGNSLHCLLVCEAILVKEFEAKLTQLKLDKYKSLQLHIFELYFTYSV